MNNTGWAFAGFLAGVIFLSSWSKLQESELVKEAISAEKDGRTINNQMMRSIYPKTYRDGSPEYLERDFEAGADLICDEIQNRYHEDICSSRGIGWR
ncbi:MAG: hypothetical protein R3D87_02000 [Paracoccaceae bacterium]